MEFKKKFQRFLTRLYFAVSDGAFFLLIIAIVFLICYFPYSLAYKQGREDGYASGYMNGASGVYVEEMTSSFKRGYVESVATTTKNIIQNVFDGFQNMFSKTAYKDEVVFGQDYIYVDGKVTERQFEIFKDSLDLLPVKLLESFVDNEWTLKLTDEDIVINYAGDKNYQAAGLMSSSQSTITIHTISQKMPHTVLHEFGHYLDHVSKNSSQNDNWVKCYKEEWAHFYILDRSFHAIGRTNEYFAEVFAWYIESPEELKENCPMSYSFMHEQVEMFR